ncbi:MAG: glycosyltransferase [Paracoccus sp. (in: a-proteobacteria)]|nr:glycosyltransferase [Paracoccus sp. (in: a-proteobacteria)]
MASGNSKTAQQQVALILGMHRSGTSFLADCLGALGYALPEDRGGPAEDNPNGHFEPTGIVALNNSFLAARGRSWLDIGVSEGGDAAPDAAQAERMRAAMAASFGDARRVVLKDPRISLLLPLWRAFLTEEGIAHFALIALRDPREVAQSLAKRDQTPREFAMLVWTAYTLGALEGSEGLARRIVIFPDWTAEPGDMLDDLARLGETRLPRGAKAAIAERFNPEHIHARPEPEPDGAEAPADALAREIFAALSEASRSDQMPGPAQLAAWRAKLAESAAPHRLAQEALGPLIRRQHEHEAALLSQLDAGEVQRKAVLDQATELLHKVGDLEKRLGAAERELAKDQTTREHLDDMIRESEYASLAIADEIYRLQDVVARAEHMLSGAATGAPVPPPAPPPPRRERPAKRRGTNKNPARALYREAYHFAGRNLRRFIPHDLVERIKRFVPGPGGIPAALAHTPLPDKRDLVQFTDVGARQRKPDIFILSIINWDFRTQRPQHLATEMARAGHRVFYVEMERDAGDGSIRKVADSVYVLRLSNRGLRALSNYSGQPSDLQARLWVDHFHHAADSLDVSPVAHVVIEHPYWWNFARHLAPQFRITFDCMDEISGFANTEAHIIEAEHDLVAKADRMIVSSQYLYDKHSASRDVVLVRNGTDVSHFTGPDTGALPEFLSGKLAPAGSGRIRVGYVGAIAEWFDTELMDRLARDNPDFDIHLCGALSADGPLALRAHGNITLHGEIPYAAVPDFLRAMDVLIIPFRLDPIILACDPVKFYEYAAVQRPTVATALPELERAGDLVRIAEGPEAFARAIREAAPLARDPANGALLRAYALDNAWSDRASDMLAEMGRAPLLSVIVLAYGDPALTLETLRSLVGVGEIYPALEVIVSDNGSPDEALAAIRAMAERHSQIRLIENGENLGFARGNNVGIEAARGDYVLLLNNDTFVAPGALYALVDHLERNPGLGIVGPMTNNIGNEAKVDISYDDMKEMALFARDLATGHRGQWTPMPVAAYFAAMFRRADLARIGNLPEIYGRGMFEDDDHCASFRKAGFEIGLAEDAFVHHHLSATFDAIPSAEKKALFERNKAIFEERWGEWAPHRYRTSRPEGTLPERK